MRILERIIGAAGKGSAEERPARRSGQQHLRNRRRGERRQGPEDRRGSFRFTGVGDRRGGQGRRNTDGTDEDYWS